MGGLTIMALYLDYCERVRELCIDPERVSFRQSDYFSYAVEIYIDNVYFMRTRYVDDPIEAVMIIGYALMWDNRRQQADKTA